MHGTQAGERGSTQPVGLTGGDYFLYVGPLLPETAADFLLRAFRQVPGDVGLVMVTEPPPAGRGAESLRVSASADPRVVLAGGISEAVRAELFTNAAAFVLPAAAPTPATLTEASSYGVPVVAPASESHRDLLGPGGPGRRLFRPADAEALAFALRVVLRNPDLERQAARALARTQVTDNRGRFFGKRHPAPRALSPA